MASPLMVQYLKPCTAPPITECAVWEARVGWWKPSQPVWVHTPLWCMSSRVRPLSLVRVGVEIYSPWFRLVTMGGFEG